MSNFWKVLFSVLLILIISVIFFLPVKDVFLFSEKASENKIFYVPIDEKKEFKIRYVHSIHLTDVVESYEVTLDNKIRLQSMSYKNLSIGLPGEAGEGETLELKDGIYTLTYKDKVIDSFILRIGRVDADLAFQYDNNEIDLKEYLEKGKAYEFKVAKLTIYQIMRGAKING